MNNKRRNESTKGATQVRLQNLKLQRYSEASQALAATVGLIGSTTLCSAIEVTLNLDGPNVGETLIAGGGGTAGNSIIYYIDSSAFAGDRLGFQGDNSSGDRIFLSSLTGGYFLRVGTSNFAAIYYGVGDSVDGSGHAGFAYVFNGTLGGALGDWSVDRPSGAVGFKNSDNEFGFLNVSWVVSTRTLTILGGKFDDSGAAITVTAVPEASDYAALLGLGVLGLACYRRRPYNRARPKQ